MISKVFTIYRQARFYCSSARPTASQQAPMLAASLPDERLAQRFGASAYAQLVEDVELLQGLGATYAAEEFRVGALTPVYFGSALDNFGVEPFLNTLIELAPSPGPRTSNQGPVAPTDRGLHRLCLRGRRSGPTPPGPHGIHPYSSGRFEKDMTVYHATQPSRPHEPPAPAFCPEERETVNEAYPGDVIELAQSRLVRRRRHGCQRRRPPIC